MRQINRLIGASLLALWLPGIAFAQAIVTPAPQPDHWDNSNDSATGMSADTVRQGPQPFSLNNQTTSSMQQGSGTIGTSAVSPNTNAGMSDSDRARSRTPTAPQARIPNASASDERGY